MIDLAVIVADAIRKQLGNKVDDVCVDFPQNTKWAEQTTIVVMERDSVLNDDHADEYNEYPGIYTTTLVIHVMAKDRKKAKEIRFAAEKIGYLTLNQLVDRDNGPVWAVWYGNKRCGQATLGNISLESTGATREMIVSNSIEP